MLFSVIKLFVTHKHRYVKVQIVVRGRGLGVCIICKLHHGATDPLKLNLEFNTMSWFVSELPEKDSSNIVVHGNLL